MRIGIGLPEAADLTGMSHSLRQDIREGNLRNGGTTIVGDVDQPGMEGI